MAYSELVGQEFDSQLQSVLPDPSNRRLDASEKKAIFELALSWRWPKEKGKDFIWGDLWPWYKGLIEMIAMIPEIWNHHPRLLHIINSNPSKQLLNACENGTVLLRPASKIGFLAIDQKSPTGVISTLCKILSGGEIRIWYSHHGFEDLRSPGAFFMRYPSCIYLWPGLPKGEYFTPDGNLHKRTSSIKPSR